MTELSHTVDTAFRVWQDPLTGMQAAAWADTDRRIYVEVQPRIARQRVLLPATRTYWHVEAFGPHADGKNHHAASLRGFEAAMAQAQVWLDEILDTAGRNEPS